MANLFIIGNGFDIDHGMRTKYCDFRQFLIDKYFIEEASLDDNICEIPSPTINQDGDEIYDEKDVATAIVQILDLTEGSTWNDIETSLGKLDYCAFLDNWTGNQNVWNGDTFDEKTFKNNYYCNESNARELRNALIQIGNYFQDWISTISISKTPIIDFQNLISGSENLFLNFNYTKTLEELYEIKNVCHIHGTFKDYIYFGHGNDKDISDKIQGEYLGAESEISDLQKSLRKNTLEAYRNNIEFFRNLETISKQDKINIYSYGFSFSDVDKFYLEKICKIIDTKDVCFYMNDFDKPPTRKKFSNKLKKCGFKGAISTFHIKNED